MYGFGVVFLFGVGCVVGVDCGVGVYFVIVSRVLMVVILIVVVMIECECDMDFLMDMCVVGWCFFERRLDGDVVLLVVCGLVEIGMIIILCYMGYICFV